MCVYVCRGTEEAVEHVWVTVQCGGREGLCRDQYAIQNKEGNRKRLWIIQLAGSPAPLGRDSGEGRASGANAF